MIALFDYHLKIIFFTEGLIVCGTISKQAYLLIITA